MVDSAKLFVVSNSVFDNYANGGVLNNFHFVPLIYYTDQSYSYNDVSWQVSTSILQSTTNYKYRILKTSNNPLNTDVTINS